MGVFIIHPCLPFCWNRYKQQGPFVHRHYPGFLATVGPIRHPLAFGPLPGFAGPSTTYPA